MDDTKFMLRDARDQINLELRKVTRRLAAEIYAEIQEEILVGYEQFRVVDISPKEIRRRFYEACRGLD